jgi:hypothetical protein
MQMINKPIAVVFCLAALLATPLGLFAGEHVPPGPRSALEAETHVRAFWRINEWEPMVSLEARAEDGFELFYRSLSLGSYYRVHRNVKVGAFYRVQQGARHDDDWIARDGSFVWRETNSRTEHLFYADVSPRFLVPQLPGTDWVFMLKNRYFYNTFNQQQWLTVRPALTWLWIVDRQPVLNVAFSYEFYVPLNFGETLLYAHWPYLNVLYHLTDTVKIDGSVAYRTRVWSTSEDVADDPAHGDYQKRIRTWTVGLGVVFRLEP